MKKKIAFIITIVLVFCNTISFSQDSVAPIIRTLDTDAIGNTHFRADFKNPVRVSAIIIPTAALAYGFVKLGNNALTNLDLEARHEFYNEHPHKQFIIDNYLQFAPGAAVFALNGLGIRGKNSLLDQSGVYLLSNIILNSATQSLKGITAVTRPDGTPRAFPSGHAAEAFASAEFLRREYGDQSVWYTVSGYTAAVAVGVLRMYNNRHWFSDVVAGAGLGVLSTQASYWLYPKIRKLLENKNNTRMVIVPYYNNGIIGAGLVRAF
jgi:membrane-associated phospholipid phosphatase